MLAASVPYSCLCTAGLPSTESFPVPAAHKSIGAVVVTGARDLFVTGARGPRSWSKSLLEPVVRWALEVDVVTGARGLCS